MNKLQYSIELQPNGPNNENFCIKIILCDQKVTFIFPNMMAN